MSPFLGERTTKRKRLSEERIIEILRLHGAGAKPADLGR